MCPCVLSNLCFCNLFTYSRGMVFLIGKCKPRKSDKSKFFQNLKLIFKAHVDCFGIVDGCVVMLPRYSSISISRFPRKLDLLSEESL